MQNFQTLLVGACLVAFAPVNAVPLQRAHQLGQKEAPRPHEGRFFTKNKDKSPSLNLATTSLGAQTNECPEDCVDFIPASRFDVCDGNPCRAPIVTECCDLFFTEVDGIVVPISDAFCTGPDPVYGEDDTNCTGGPINLGSQALQLENCFSSCDSSTNCTCDSSGNPCPNPKGMIGIPKGCVDSMPAAPGDCTLENDLCCSEYEECDRFAFSNRAQVYYDENCSDVFPSCFIDANTGSPPSTEWPDCDCITGNGGPECDCEIIVTSGTPDFLQSAPVKEEAPELTGWQEFEEGFLSTFDGSMATTDDIDAADATVVETVTEEAVPVAETVAEATPITETVTEIVIEEAPATETVTEEAVPVAETVTEEAPATETATETVTETVTETAPVIEETAPVDETVEPEVV